jgi:hypothetical protein
MNLEVNLVGPGQIAYCISSLLKYLQKSEDWTRGRAAVDDIIRFIYTGQMNLWIVYEPETKVAYGYMVTEIKQYPRCKMLVVQYTAAEPHIMKHVEDKVQDILERFGRDAGCAGIESWGRHGWKKHLDKYGYKSSMAVYEKFFSGDKS